MTVEHLKQRLVPLELQKDVVGDYSELVKGDCLAPWFILVGKKEFRYDRY